MQLDNCADNKSKIVLAYCCDLARRSCTRRITISTLLRGHTHIDIDSWFGVFSRALTRDEALTLPAYESVLRGAFKNVKNAPDIIEIISYVRDWDRYYLPHIDERFCGHCSSEASGNATHQFIFEQGANNADGSACGVMYYAQYMTSRERRPQPLQINELWKPLSINDAKTVFGERWDAVPVIAKSEILSNGIEVGAANFSPSDLAWCYPLVGYEGVVLKLPSPGIKLLVSEPDAVPDVARVPPKWYQRIDGNTAEFAGLERTIEAMIDANYFRNDIAARKWWEAWLESHEPRDEDGGCAARDNALLAKPFAWLHAPPAAVTQVQAPVAVVPEAQRSDWLPHQGQGRAMLNRGAARVALANELASEGPHMPVVQVEIGQLCIYKWLSHEDADETKHRLALGALVRYAPLSKVTPGY